MSRSVRIHGDAAVYPAGACVSCLRPATREVEIVKVKGHSVRKVDVPYCDECVALRKFKSARQVAFERAATVNSLLLALTVGLYTCVRASSAIVDIWAGSANESGRIPMGQWSWALVLGALSALVVFGVMYLIIEPWSRRFRSAPTRAALQAVTIRDFDWETTTLEFRDGEYAEQFARANQRASSHQGERHAIVESAGKE
jgi:hypothetical protein